MEEERKEQRQGKKRGRQGKVNPCLRKILLGIALVRVLRETEPIGCGCVFIFVYLLMYVRVYSFVNLFIIRNSSHYMEANKSQDLQDELAR